MTRFFPKSFRAPKRSKLENVTLRGFGGGWNAVDDDISMGPKYLKTLRNFHRQSSGAQAVRWGTKLFKNISATVTGNIVDGEYFNNRLVIVTTTGQVCTITDDGTIAAIWTSAIAAVLPGAPTGWGSSFTSVDFVPFKNTLIIHNGVDKPIEVSATFTVRYLQDLATGSNINVPIGKYGCVVSNFHCIAGIPASPTVLYISSQGTSGTFPGDPPPNDAISIDVGAYAPEGAASIRGIAGFRTTLIVFLQGVSILITLGNYNDSGTHVPEFPDTFPKFGLLGHRCINIVDNDLLFGGLNGLSSATKNLFSGQLNSEYLSSLIEPEYRGTMAELTDAEQLNNCFSIYDPLSHDYLLFIQHDPAHTEHVPRIICYTAHDKLRYKAWSEFDGMHFDGGCTSFLGRVFLFKDTKVYQMGNGTFEDENYTADLLYDYSANWAVATLYTEGDLIQDTLTSEVYECIVTHTSPVSGTFEDDRETRPENWEEYLGEPISFFMELPWFDGKDPMRTKHLKFVSVATKGTAEFEFNTYVDNLYKDADGEVAYDPALSMVFIGNDADGFGFDDGPYGGGRRSATPLLYNYPVKFKAAKFVIEGEAIRPLQIVNISFLYAKGNFLRG